MPASWVAEAVYANLNRARPAWFACATQGLRSAGLDRNLITRKKQERIPHPNGPDQGAGSQSWIIDLLPWNYVAKV